MQRKAFDIMQDFIVWFAIKYFINFQKQMQVQGLPGCNVLWQCMVVSQMSGCAELGVWNCWIFTQSSESLNLSGSYQSITDTQSYL